MAVVLKWRSTNELKFRLAYAAVTANSKTLLLKKVQSYTSW